MFSFYNVIDDTSINEAYILIHSSNSFTQFSYFVNVCEKIHATTSKNMKVNILSEYLFSLNDESLSIAALFFSNRIFPRGSLFTLNIGFSIIMQVLSEIASLDPNHSTDLPTTWRYGCVIRICSIEKAYGSTCPARSFNVIIHT